jgi:hypothetical protein
MSEIFNRGNKITEQPDSETDILSFVEMLTESAETKPSECIEQSAKLLNYAVVSTACLSPMPANSLHLQPLRLQTITFKRKQSA